MKTCVFCGEKAGSKEHIIAQWMITRMGAEKMSIVVAEMDGNGKITERPKHTLNNYTTRAVCNNCNNGWMSTLETWFQSNLGYLVEPAWPKLANDMLNLAAKENHMLAKWALKTAVMMNSNSEMDSIKDNEMRTALFQQYVVNHVYVDIAHIHKRDINKIMSRGFRVTNGNDAPQWQARHDYKAYTCLIQLNHLAIRVFRCVGAEPYYAIKNARIPLRMYPVAYDANSIDYRFHTLREVEQALSLTTNIGMG